MQKSKYARNLAAIILAAILTLTTVTTSGSAFAADEIPGLPYGSHAQDALYSDADYAQNIAEEMSNQPYEGQYIPHKQYCPVCIYLYCPDETPCKYVWKYDITGNFYNLQLLSVEYGIASAIITQNATCNGFYATSDNFTNWRLTGPATQQDEYINEPPHMDLAEAGIIRIERLPFQIEDGITWVGFAILLNQFGDIWREQIRIFVDEEWLNPLPLTPEPTPAITGLNGFSWAREAVEFVVARDLLDMYPCNETNEPIAFNPTGNATRGDVLAAAIKALNLTAPEFEETSHIPFYDVPLTGRGVYIDIAKQLGLVVGVGHNHFAPNQTITRQDMMTMLYNIMMSMGQIQPDTGLTSLGRFNDFGEISSYARLPISSLARVGIIAGDGVSINPRGYINRVEAAMFVRNLYRVGE